MKQTVLLDTGPLVAMLNRRETQHSWVLKQMASIKPPLFTCEAVIAEAFHLVRHLPAARRSIMEMIQEQVLTISFCLAEQCTEISTLVEKYASVPMSLADACLVRMSEQDLASPVFTLDSDFEIYRRNKRQRIPLLIPSRV